MSFKLAIKNVGKSVKDYLVYFLTLSFGVCLFYMFNSMDSQQAAIKLTRSQAETIKLLTRVISYVSIFISVILGFLIVYANQFLIKRRKKELGLYMVLGMKKQKISAILIIETLFIGILSLVVGLLAGIFLSQGLSILTAKLFETNLSAFHFIFSWKAASKSILYFGIIFLIVMIFNSISISKYKLIDLLTAEKKNQNLHLHNICVSIVLFIASVGILGFAYHKIIKNGLYVLNNDVRDSIILGCIGTVLFFFSLSGLFLVVLKRLKKFYYKNLNMFVMRQVNSRINSSFISMSIICIMLFLTICTLSCGLNIASSMSSHLRETTPADMQMIKFSLVDSKKNNGVRFGNKVHLDMNKEFTKYVKTYSKTVKSHLQTDIYQDTSFTLKDMIPQKYLNSKELPLFVLEQKLYFDVIPISEYNSFMKFTGKKEIVLAPNEYALSFSFPKSYAIFEKIHNNLRSITLFGTKLAPSKLNIQKACLQNGIDNFGTIIVPDSVVAEQKPIRHVLSLNYFPNADEQTFIDEVRHLKNDMDCPLYETYNSKNELYQHSLGLKTIASYLSIYLGFIFLITSAAILALQQLSEANDNAYRYQLLQKLGSDRKMVNHALYSQISISFFLPLLLAIVHSIIGLHVGMNFVSLFGSEVKSGIIFTAITFVVIYGGYFLATCQNAKSVIKTRF